jgi:hypothetical protein
MWQSSNTKCAQVKTMYTAEMHIIYIYSFLLCLWYSHVQFCNNKLENLTLWYLHLKKKKICSTIIITVYSTINMLLNSIQCCYKNYFGVNTHYYSKHIQNVKLKTTHNLKSISYYFEGKESICK